MTKSVKANKPATPVIPVTPPNTSKRAVARLKVREAKYGTIHPRDRQVWLADTNTWEHLVDKTVDKLMPLVRAGLFND